VSHGTFDTHASVKKCVYSTLDTEEGSVNTLCKQCQFDQS